MILLRTTFVLIFEFATQQTRWIIGDLAQPLLHFLLGHRLLLFAVDAGVLSVCILVAGVRLRPLRGGLSFGIGLFVILLLPVLLCGLILALSIGIGV